MASSGSDGNEGKEAALSRPQPPLKETTTVWQLLTILTKALTSLFFSLPAVSESLPFDLLVEILYRLPVKTLLQLRCVCKSWNSLISDPNFAKKHLSYSRMLSTRHHLIQLSTDCDSEPEFHLQESRLSCIFDSTSSIIMESRLRYLPKVQNLYDMIIGSCDGIICFTTGGDDFISFLIWNPSINKFKISPPLEMESNYNPISSFGYDHFNDDYKVVVVCVYLRDMYTSNWVCKTQVNVHTLGTNSWRRIQDFPFDCVPGCDSGKFVSGAINWLASTRTRSRVIVSLDLGNESYQEILQPNYGDVDVDVQILTLGVLRDCLCIFSHFYNFGDVWVMKDYGNKESWTKLFSIPCEVFGRERYIPAHAHYISLDDQILLDIDNEVVVYNSKNGTLKIPEFQYIYSHYFNKDIYIESLISP